MSNGIVNDLVWYGKIPNDWHGCRIKDVSRLSPPFSQNKPDDIEACTVVPMEFVSEFGEVDSSQQQLFQDVSDGLPNFEEGDVIFAKITPCMENGKGAFIEKIPTRYAFGSTEFHVLRTSRLIDGKFLYYFTFNPTYRKYAETNMTGAAGQKRVSSNFLKYTRIFLPPIEVQAQIAQYLDQTCTAIDRTIAIKQDQFEKLDTFGKSQISKVMVEGINPGVQRQTVNSTWFDEIPAHWTLRRLKDAITLQTGITLGKEYDGELVEYPYLRVANVQDGYLNLDDITTIFLPKRDVPRYLLRTGDVLMTEGGDLDKLGRGHVWRGEIEGCLHQNHVFAVRCDENKLLPEYLAFLTSSNHGRNYFEITGKRTTNLASTNSTKVGLFPVPLPPVDEQLGIIEYLNTELKKIGSIKTGVERQIEVLQDYKKSLIHECVTGKCRITEAALRDFT
jgi:type I restriction enzyme, S subunit